MSGLYAIIGEPIKKGYLLPADISTAPQPKRKGTARTAPASPAEASTELSRFTGTNSQRGRGVGGRAERYNLYSFRSTSVIKAR